MRSACCEDAMKHGNARKRRNSDGPDNLDITHATAGTEIRRRMPWMLLALAAGAVMVVVGQHFEHALASRLELALFVPMIVYMSDTIGTETLALFVRELALRKVVLRKLFLRELGVGLSLGVATGVPMALFSYLWFEDVRLAGTILTAMTVNGLVAVLTGMLIPIAFAKFRKDPALGTDELTTALSDNVSLLVYLAVASLILFS
jgi:magnesium transporter